MPTIAVIDGNDVLQNIERPNANGRQDADGSRPVALSTEDLATLAEIAGALVAILEKLNLDDLPNGAATAAAQGEGNAALAEILAAFNAGLTLTGGLVECEIDGATYPGVKPGDIVPVVDGSARLVRVPRHILSTGSAQQAAAPNANRVYLELFNGSDRDQWYRYDGDASIGGAGSIQLRPGDRDIYDGARVTPIGAISVVCGESGRNLSIWEA